MQSFVDVVFVLLIAAAAGTSARSLPDLFHVRQDTNDLSGSAACNNARVVTNTTITSGPTTVELATFDCAPMVRANEALLPLVGPHSLVGPPSPLARTTTTLTRTRTATRTSIVTSTRTATRTSTATVTPTTTATATVTATEIDTATETDISITTATATATETDIETDTATETATETLVIPTTVIQSVTDTATETATLVTTSATTIVESFTETATATETQLTTSATTLIESVTDTATLVVTATVTAAAPTPTLTNVCADTCTTACAQPGGILNFAPSAEDCARLVDTLNSGLTTGTSPFVTLAPGQMFAASHGTCRFAFFNFAPTTVETCVLSIIRSASAAVSGCFEGAQPAAVSEGLCLATDGLWEVSVTHT